MKNKEAKSIFSSLENYSSIPPPELWDKIEAELDKPKEKKRPLVWWWVAACFVAGLSISSFLYINSNQGNDMELNIQNDTNGVVLQKEIEEKKSRIEESNIFSKEVINNNAIQSNTEKNSVVNSNSVSNKSIVTISSISNNSKKNSFKKEQQHQSIAEVNDKSQSESEANNQAVTVVSANSVFPINGNSNANDNTIASTDFNKNQNKEDKVTATSQLLPANQNSDMYGKNNDKAIAENSSSKDSLSIIKKEVEQLEKALVALDKDKTKKKITSEVIDKWSLQVFAGVMSSENYSNDKALGNTVESKQSSGYGVKTNYKLNKKWAVSSGFKINELGQKIDGVSYYQRSNVTISGVLPIASDDMLQNSFVNNNAVVFVSNNENYLFSTNSKASSGYETGNVTQNLKYFEMPLEISYALLSKRKTNISMNTGGFVGKLISNDVLLNGTSIGENNNVNEYVYGTVLSSTLQYEFYKKTRFFIEPGMNYYINPLDNQSFNQFQWMFNFGLNVSF